MTVEDLNNKLQPSNLTILKVGVWHGRWYALVWDKISQEDCWRKVQELLQ